ncbi:MAG: toxin-antitoxin system TumE family protein [Candidatus Bathyarchaeales archaeon]
MVFTEDFYGKLRLHVSDESYIDIWFSMKIPGRYAYHWERRHIDGSIYRHDNRPHVHLKNMETFPKHFHDGSDENVVESYLSEDPVEAIKTFLEFVRRKLRG